MGGNAARPPQRLTADIAAGLGSLRRAMRGRAAITRAGKQAENTLRARVVDIAHPTGVAWRVLPLRAGDDELLADVAWLTHLPALPPARQARLRQLAGQASRALSMLTPPAGGAPGGVQRRQATRLLRRLDAWARDQRLDKVVAHYAQPPVQLPRRVAVADATAGWVGLPERLGGRDDDALTFSGEDLDRLRGALRRLSHRQTAAAKAREKAQHEANAARLPHVRAVLAAAPLVRLLDVSSRPLHLSSLHAAGFSTVADILAAPERLTQVEGVGVTTASQVIAAAKTYAAQVMAATPVVPDADRGQPFHALLSAVEQWRVALAEEPTEADREASRRLAPVQELLTEDVAALVVLGAQLAATRFRQVSDAAVEAAFGSMRDCATGPTGSLSQRGDDAARLLDQLGVLTRESEAGLHDVPAEVLQAVRAQPLVTDDLRRSLRGYQEFGAKFALAQRRVLLGDEMGLGKTVEALAVLAHLHASGMERFLVVVPAAVVPNWLRETVVWTRLSAHRLHGDERESALREWGRRGGVAVTTYESLPWLLEAGLPATLDATVVDEAHYVKNPRAARTRHTQVALDRSAIALLLTGTPLLNNLDEFAELIGHLRPDLVVDAHLDNPARLRAQVAPAYLRRGVEDVLDDLPEVVEVDQWVPMSPADQAAYRAAVESSSFMAMRHAAMSAGSDSAKVQRLIELVDEATATGRNVIVYSYFLDVLDLVAGILPGVVIGPLTGSTPPDDRQAMVDILSTAGSGATLIAQVVAGGQGLNIQAASVVILCEPQLTPALEWQAIGRARRLGQQHRVQVHRLLNDEGVDVRVRALADRKVEIFDDYARVSDTAQAAAGEPVDGHRDRATTADIVADERARILGRPDPWPITP